MAIDTVLQIGFLTTATLVGAVLAWVSAWGRPRDPESEESEESLESLRQASKIAAGGAGAFLAAFAGLSLAEVSAARWLLVLGVMGGMISLACAFFVLGFAPLRRVRLWYFLQLVALAFIASAIFIFFASDVLTVDDEPTEPVVAVEGTY